jgi:FkbM family methyltransferase
LDAGWRVDTAVGGCVYLLARDGLRIKCRYDHGNDLGHLNEIFVGKVYGSEFNGKIVVDVGMSNGDSSLFFIHMGAEKVIGLEPSRESFDMAVDNIKSNGMQDKSYLLNSALFAVAAETSLFESSSNPGVNSLEPVSHMKSRFNYDTKENVKTIEIKQLIESLGLEKIDLLKMDCEGCEYGVFRTISRENLAIVREIVVEFHDGPQDLVQILETNGFEVSLAYNRDFGNRLGYLKARRRLRPTQEDL